MVNRANILTGVLLLIFIALFGGTGVPAQTLNFERERGRRMLDDVKNDLRRHYYDPTIRGIDLDARVRTADERIRQATSIGQIFGIIAQVVMELNDSHTVFIPPQRASRTEYGWQMQIFGDEAYVTSVRAGSDAAAQGLRPGDRILTVDGVDTTRENMWVYRYLYYVLRPKPSMRLTVQSPGGQPREVTVQARITEGRQVTDLTGRDGGIGIWDLIREAEDRAHSLRHRYVERPAAAFVWKMPLFDLEGHEVDEMMERARAQPALILDLRGNVGGREDTLLRLAGQFFDRDVTIGELQRRRGREPLMARTRGGNRVFTGKLIVLVDSHSASSSELFARLVQLEKRGTVIGDRTAGAVMRSRIYPHQFGTDTVSFHYISVTDADLLMTDGRSLEGTGVTPDEVVVPTGADLAERRDPALARAFVMVGLQMTPEQAGAVFPVDRPK